MRLSSCCAILLLAGRLCQVEAGDVPDPGMVTQQYQDADPEVGILVSILSAPIRQVPPHGGLLYRLPGPKIGQTIEGEKYRVLERRYVRQAFHIFEWVKIVGVSKPGRVGWTYWGEYGKLHESPTFRPAKKVQVRADGN